MPQARGAPGGVAGGGAKETDFSDLKMCLSQLGTMNRGQTLTFTSSFSVVQFCDHCAQDKEFGLESLSLYGSNSSWSNYASVNLTIYISVSLLNPF